MSKDKFSLESKVLRYFVARGMNPLKTRSQTFGEKYAYICLLGSVLQQHSVCGKFELKNLIEFLPLYAALVANRGDANGIDPRCYGATQHDLLRIQPCALRNIQRSKKVFNQIVSAYLNYGTQHIQTALEYALIT